MADISVPGLALDTPVAADSVPGVRSSTGLLDARFTLSSIRTFANAALAGVATTGQYSSLTGLPTLGTIAALSYPGGSTTFLRGDGTFATPVYGSLSGLPTLGNVAALTYPGSGTNYLKSTGAFGQVAYSEVSGTPSLATVATSGVYADLTGKPTLGNVSALTYSGSGTNYLKSTGAFAQVAYGELSGTPTLGNVAALTYAGSGSNYLKSTGAFAQVAYSELSGLPTLGTVAALSYPGGTTTWLRADGTWTTTTGGMTNPMTTSQDIIVGGSSGTPGRLAVGANGTFLGVSAGAIVWTTPSGSGDVVGPASSTNEHIVVFDGTTGKLIKSGSITLATLATTLLNNSALTGVPTAATAAVDTNTTQVASTAFVVAQASASNPLMNGSVAIGTSLRYSRQDHVHASDTSRAPVASPTFTGIPAGPTAAVDTNTTQLATTAFVVAQASATNPLMNGSVAIGTSLRYSRQDHVHASDTSRAPVASPTFTGNPTAPTPTAGDNDTSIATTAFVTDAVLGGKRIELTSRSAAYTLVAADANAGTLHPSADVTARIMTIPANSSVAFPVGTSHTWVNQNGAGTLTIAITTDTMRLAGAGTTGSRTLAANGIATALKITSTEWIINGTGLT